MCPLSTSNNGIDGSVLVDFLNVKVALPILPISRAISAVMLPGTGPAAPIGAELG